ncbi:hypothetical protein [Streptococcus sciuri]|uniref:Phage protein n=1 Tax=Streptococcus sciuri TaxID=2973939 RepID=A0ABT2F7I0_9STRE|nr:hypothetical protein [Streptococcus sciuri]MCS4488362.1 hypothetical protein [Streptococcus sciuri]
MTIENSIYAGLIIALAWSLYEDYKVNKRYQKLLSEKQALEKRALKHLD